MTKAALEKFAATNAELKARAIESISWFQDRAAELHDGIAEGDVATAWRALRRIRHYAGPRVIYATPVWRGQPVSHLTILTGDEAGYPTGYGDTFWLARYFPRAASIAERVTVHVRPRAKRLLQQSITDCEFVTGVDGKARAVREADAVVDLFFLPAAMDDRNVRPAPYLSPDENEVAAYRATLARDRLNVGVCWGSEDIYQHAKDRSAQPSDTAPLAELDGVAWHSLMRRPGAVTPMPLTEYSPADFADTAALIGALDAVVTTDTAVANLAGAMGAPTFVVIGSEANFRWGIGRTTPWFPTVRVCRAGRGEPWRDVFARAGAELTAEMGAA